MSNIDKYGIEKGFNYHSNMYVKYGRKYEVTDLIEAANAEVPFDLDLRSIDLSSTPWGTSTSMHSFIYHMTRVDEATLDHPIILDDTGYVCDGWHRIGKAILESKDTIKAVRLRIMPDAIT